MKTAIAYFTMVAMMLAGGAAHHFDWLAARTVISMRSVIAIPDYYKFQEQRGKLQKDAAFDHDMHEIIKLCESDDDPCLCEMTECIYSDEMNRCLDYVVGRHE